MSVTDGLITNFEPPVNFKREKGLSKLSTGAGSGVRTEYKIFIKKRVNTHFEPVGDCERIA